MSAERWEPQLGECVGLVSVDRWGYVRRDAVDEVTRRTSARVWVGDLVFLCVRGTWRTARRATSHQELRRLDGLLCGPHRGAHDRA